MKKKKKRTDVIACVAIYLMQLLSGTMTRYCRTVVSVIVSWVSTTALSSASALLYDKFRWIAPNPFSTFNSFGCDFGTSNIVRSNRTWPIPARNSRSLARRDGKKSSWIQSIFFFFSIRSHPHPHSRLPIFSCGFYWTRAFIPFDLIGVPNACVCTMRIVVAHSYTRSTRSTASMRNSFLWRSRNLLKSHKASFCHGFG